IPVNIIQSVMATGPCSLIEFGEKIQAVITFKEQPQAQLLIDANKRIHNILKKQNLSEKLTINPALCSELEEIKLLGILRDNKDNVIKLVKDRDYTGSLMILASLKEPVDEFFNAVLVMDNNPAVRDNRLAILSELRELFLLTADFSHL
ncbi:MAG: DALR anticodon-binding domain-containing protein, partial [Bacteroidota bacterium]